ncbi:MAG: nuclear transport factor 2 family protein [Pseudomonadota bacterium]
MLPRMIPAVIAASLLVASAAAQSPLDRMMIIEAAARLDTAVDAKEWAGAEALFTETISFTYGDQTTDSMPAADLVGLWRTNLFAEKASFHLRGDHIISFDDRRSATLHSKAYAWNRLEGMEGGELYEVWGDYTYSLVKEDGIWLITGFAFQPQLERGNTALPAYRPVD